MGQRPWVTSQCCTAVKYQLHCSALHHTALHCSALHCAILLFTVLYYTAKHHTELPYTASHCNPSYTALRLTALPCTAARYTDAAAGPDVCLAAATNAACWRFPAKISPRQLYQVLLGAHVPGS